jgi:hypothetical protein
MPCPSIVETVTEQLRLLQGAPSVQMVDMPARFLKESERPQLMDGLGRQHGGEFYDGASDQDAGSVDTSRDE